MKLQKTKKRLEGYVEEQFGMQLNEFLKIKVEQESLYDYEIAEILNVRPGSIGALRSISGIKRSNGFARRFEKTYGPGAVESFKVMIENPDISLSCVARHFGFSREYGRQVYKKIYNSSYAKAYRQKQEIRREARLFKGRKSRKLDSLIKVKEKMASLGLRANLKKGNHGYMLLTNGYKLALRCTFTPKIKGTTQCFYISNSKGGFISDYDFIIGLCVFREKSIHHILPQDVMPKNGVSLLPYAGPEKSKYAKFKEAWHLLKHDDIKDACLSPN